MMMRHEDKKAGREEGKKARVSDLLTFSCSPLLFFVLCFIYLWLVVEPHLIYHCFGTILPDAPPFVTGWSFLRESLGMPGGLAAYASGFLSLGYYYAWLGAAIIVLAGVCLSELSRRHLVAAGLPHASVLAAFPAIMLFLIYSHYKHPLTICLAVSLGLLLSLILERLPLRQPLIRVAAYSLAGVVGFSLGGGGTLLVFLLMTVVHALGRVCTAHHLASDQAVVGVRCTPYELLALPASVAIAWALVEYVFLLPARQALLILTPFAPSVTAGMDTFPTVLVFLLCGFVPLTVLLTFVGKSVFGARGKKADVPARKKEKYAATQGKRPSWAIFAKPALSALPVVLMALGLYFSYDELSKPYVLSNYYCRQKRWDKIVELSRRLPKDRTNVYVNHDTLRALYHTGRLPYDMFRCPLVPEAILLTHEDRQSDLTQWKLSDIFLELGHVNMAEKLASEVLTTKGHLGIALEELGWISIIKGQPGTARVYLNALKKDPIYRGRAESLLRGMNSGFPPDQVDYIDRIRSCMRDETAGVTGMEPVDETLAALLARNPRNKMAFEYLMACYLLTSRVDKIVENADRLHDFGYPRTPTLYEEAILIYYGSQAKAVDLTRFNISRETLQRYEAFVRLNRDLQSQNSQAAMNRLIREFGASYFFYYSFGRVGSV